MTRAIHSGCLFLKLVNPLDKKLIAKALLNIKYLILSLESMNVNLFYLGVRAKLIKRFVTSKYKSGTVRSTLFSKWEKPRVCLIKTSQGVI